MAVQNMTGKYYDFVQLMLKKSEEGPTELKDPFSNLNPKEIEILTKKIMDKK